MLCTSNISSNLQKNSQLVLLYVLIWIRLIVLGEQKYLHLPKFFRHHTTVEQLPTCHSTPGNVNTANLALKASQLIHRLVDTFHLPRLHHRSKKFNVLLGFKFKLRKKKQIKDRMYYLKLCWIHPVFNHVASVNNKMVS